MRIGAGENATPVPSDLASSRFVRTGRHVGKPSRHSLVRARNWAPERITLGDYLQERWIPMKRAQITGVLPPAVAISDVADDE